ncbi:SEC-C metal-binding domain-containing protein [Nocardioides bruguierae]|uniref:SEC-C metal-binding domain-containing protein n=1 Tax=Nocardioides bruguierae TaxID=2945102 RepID=A0A9X2D681_9ACTN|nr:SEC-C metal-binding domain-containing protein [Nocardioides bruguierae]MCM0619592.1 SEC-C metal-binding domain-containing protein [Nocardioides bruguierae]
MTLIGFATYPDHIEFVTDTAKYTRHVEKLGTTTKHQVFAHLDAAVMTQGSEAFGIHATATLLEVAGQVAEFDELVQHAPRALQFAHDAADQPNECLAILLGYSQSRSEWTGVAFASDRGFKPTHARTWLQPMPWTIRPTGLELRRVKGWMDGHPDLPAVVDQWTASDPLTPPDSDAAWVSLAQESRNQRSGEPFAHVVVHGDLIHTRLEAGAATTRALHHFTDDTATLFALLHGTRHPYGQAQNCPCGTGLAYRDCCLRDHWGDPCGCRSGLAFESCCLIPATAASLDA